MSYCRFSSDCYQSDVYVYESSDGPFVVEVASSRYLSPDPRPVYPQDGTIEQLVAYHLASQDWVKGASLVPIGGPNDSNHMEVDDAEEAAEILGRLRELGYHIPVGVIEALQEEGTA